MSRGTHIVYPSIASLSQPASSRSVFLSSLRPFLSCTASSVQVSWTRLEDWVQTGLIPFGHVVVMSHQAPKNVLYPSPSASLFELFTTCSRVCPLAHNPTLTTTYSLAGCLSRPLRRILYFFFYTTACPSGSRWCVPQWCSFTLFKHKVGNLKTTLFVLRHWGSRLAIEVYIRSVGGHLWFNHIYSFDWVLYYFCQSRKSTVLEDGRHQNKETKCVWFLRSICCSHGDCWE